MAELKNEYGGCSIERILNFERKIGYIESIKLEMKTDAVLSPEKTKEMTAIIDKAVGEARKIVEKW